MHSFGKLIRAAGTLIVHPSSIIRVLPLEDEWKKSVQRKYGLLNGLPTIDLLDLFPDFHVTVEPYSFLEGTSTAMDIALLNAFAQKKKGCAYLEIGTWKGESVSNVARFADKCVSICFSNEEMRERGLSEEYIGVHGFFSGGLENVTHIKHDSQTFDFFSLNEQFDLVFIDGDHSPQGVEVDTRNAFQLLKDDRSIIVWHDYGWSPETVRWDVLAGILDGCPKELRKYLYHVSNTLCAAFIRSDFNTIKTKPPRIPDKNFTITIRAEKI